MRTAIGGPQPTGRPPGPPTSGADVTIDTADLHTITYGSGDGSSSVNSLTVGNDVFQLNGGALTIASAASFANLLQVTGGTLELGTVAATAASFEQDGGTVDGTAALTVSGAATFTGRLTSRPARGRQFCKGRRAIPGRSISTAGGRWRTPARSP